MHWCRTGLREGKIPQGLNLKLEVYIEMHNYGRSRKGTMVDVRGPGVLINHWSYRPRGFSISHWSLATN